MSQSLKHSHSSARFPDASAASQNPPRATKQSQLWFVFVCRHFASHIDLHCKHQTNQGQNVETLDHFSSYLLGLVPNPFCLSIIRQSGADLSWSQNDFPPKHVLKIPIHQSLTFHRFEVMNHLQNASQLCEMANICINICVCYMCVYSCMFNTHISEVLAFHWHIECLYITIRKIAKSRRE